MALAFLAIIGSSRGAEQQSVKPATPAYPLKVSANRRYLLDQNNQPFLIAGESPQALMVNLSEEEAEMFFANRRSHGFNTVWINLLCKPYTGGRPDGSTVDRILPFTKPDDLSAPNEDYFERCDHMLRLAAQHGLLVMLDPIETGDFLKVMVQNGPAKCREYGRYLGSRYQGFDNLLWFHGNDYQNWRDPTNDAAVTAVAYGIKEKDPRHLHTIELDYEISGSLDDPNWAPIISLCASYTYYPVYAQVLKDYNRSNFVPVCLIESDYEFERDSIPVTLRRQEYWANLSGATGQLYGNGFTWPFKLGWKTNLDTPGAIQMAYVKALFERYPWFELIPDQTHQVVTAGYGTFDAVPTEGNHFNMTSDYVTAGRTPDGSLVMAYMPTFRPVTVDLKKMSGPVTARWYDPSCGRYSGIEGSPFANTAKHVFIPPRHNADGDDDWVLVLEAPKNRQSSADNGPDATRTNAPLVLPGKGLAEHDFFYAGEGKEERMFVVRNGRVAWSYTHPGKGEISDATLLPDGNVFFAHQFGVTEVNSKKEVVWNLDAPPNTEIHTAQPMGSNRIWYIQNGDPAKFIVINRLNGSTEHEFVLPVRNPKSIHGQFRHARLTDADTVLVAHMDLGKVAEYDLMGKELWSTEIPGVWSATPLKNGNILAVSNRGFVRETNRQSKSIWEWTAANAPGYEISNLQLAVRLSNGNTIINNWFNEWSGTVDRADPPVQAIEVAPDKKIVWALRSWSPPADLGPATTIQMLEKEPLRQHGS
jgi:hypothetical protein